MTGELASRIRAANAAIVANGSAHAAEEFFAKDYVAHGTGGIALKGAGAVRRFAAGLRRAFPEIEVEVEILLEDGDRVCWQRTMRGVQRGAYKGFPASGRRIVWRDMVVSRFRGGLIAEDWVITDLAERLLRAGKR